MPYSRSWIVIQNKWSVTFFQCSFFRLRRYWDIEQTNIQTNKETNKQTLCFVKYNSPTSPLFRVRVWRPFSRKKLPLPFFFYRTLSVIRLIVVVQKRLICPLNVCLPISEVKCLFLTLPFIPRYTLLLYGMFDSVFFFLFYHESKLCSLKYKLVI